MSKGQVSLTAGAQGRLPSLSLVCSPPGDGSVVLPEPLPTAGILPDCFSAPPCWCVQTLVRGHCLPVLSWSPPWSSFSLCPSQVSFKAAVGVPFIKCKLTVCLFSAWDRPGASQPSAGKAAGAGWGRCLHCPPRARPQALGTHLRASAPALGVPPAPAALWFSMAPAAHMPLLWNVSLTRGAALSLARQWVSGLHLALGGREREVASGVLHTLPWPPIRSGSV